MLKLESKWGYTVSGPAVLGGGQLLLELSAETPLVSDTVGHSGAHAGGEERPWVYPRVVSG